jgi:hypothetical protein
MTLPVLTICFNNHEFVANTVAQLRAFGVDDITVIDNASSWDATRAYLDTLEAQGCTLIRNSQNLGHLCWTRPEIFNSLPDKFCITDPDLQFNPRLPADFMSVMAQLADRFMASKVGFALDLSDSALMFQYPDYHQGQSSAEWENKFWRQRVPGEALEVYLAEVDTTFHVFNKRGLAQRQLRVAGEYTAKHLPWYRINALIPSERMTQMYRQATSVSTTARFHMRQHEGMTDQPAPPAVQLRQIAYSAQSLAGIEPGYTMLDNLSNARPDWHEYWPIRDFLHTESLDEEAFYGFLSPEFGDKTGLSHAQVTAFVQQHAAEHDVMLFSPQPDMAALFLNMFEQGETFDPGLIDAVEGFLRVAGVAHPPLRTLVMDSSQIVFSNYFVARPAFWRRWLALGEQLFDLCEGPSHPERDACLIPSVHAGGAQRKVLIQERLASLLLALEPRWRAKAADPYSFAWSATPLGRFRQEAVLSDALKLAYRRQGFGEYLSAFSRLREDWLAPKVSRP